MKKLKTSKTSVLIIDFDDTNVIFLPETRINADFELRA